MIHPSYVELMKVVNEGTDVGEEPVVNSRYSIVCATAKRARQIIDGKEPLIDYHEKDKPLSIAVKELYEGELRILNDDEAAEMAEQEKKVKEIIRQRREEAEALAKVNAVRERAYGSQDGNLADFSEASYKSFYIYDAPEGGFKAIDIILDERARELYAERTRWIDLRRTKQLARYNAAYNPNLVSTVKTLRPIPANEISANSSISDQNPGY